MAFKHLFYTSAVLGFLGTLSSPSYGMVDQEDSLSSFRVQTASVARSQGLPAVHSELERQANLAPGIKNYSAYIYGEQNSKWYRTQLKCASQQNATDLCNYLKTTALAGLSPMVVNPQQVTPGQNLRLELCLRHYWAQK